MMDLQLGTPPNPSAGAFIKDTDEQGFETDVLTASMQRPVIVDFWAPWCVPCKQMMPLIEKAVTAAAGGVALVKVNIDKNPGLAQALRIQSVPTVYAFFQGKPVDGFAGAKGEPELKQFVAKLVALAGGAVPPADIKKLMVDADQFFLKGDVDSAMTCYGAALDADPENMEPLGGIGWCLIAQGDAPGAADMLSQLTPEQLKSPRLKGLSFILTEFPDGKVVEAIDALIERIRLNRADPAKDRLLQIFDALGNAHPLTMPGRRKLSSVLFS